MGLQQGTNNSVNFSSGSRDANSKTPNRRHHISEQNNLLNRKRPIDYFNTCRTTLKRTLITSAVASIVFTAAPPLTETVMDLFGDNRVSKETIVKKETDISKEILRYAPVYRIEGIFSNNDSVSFTSKPVACSLVLKQAPKKPETLIVEAKGLDDSVASAVSKYLNISGVRPDTFAIHVDIKGTYHLKLGMAIREYYVKYAKDIATKTGCRFGISKGISVNFWLQPENITLSDRLNYFFSPNEKISLKPLVKQAKVNLEVTVAGRTKGNPSGIYLLFIPVWRIYRRWRKDYWGVFMDKLASKNKDFQKPDKLGFFEPFAPDDYDKERFDRYMDSTISERKEMRDEVTLRHDANYARKVILLMDIEDYYWAKYMVSPTLEVGKKVLAQQEKRLNECFDKETKDRLSLSYSMQREEALIERWQHYNPIRVEDSIPGGYHWDEDGGKLYLGNPSMREFFWPVYLAKKEYYKKMYGGEP